MGIAYHGVYFSPINNAAYLFGIGFILQGLLFLWFGFIKRKLSFAFQNNFSGRVGGVIILYATGIYPWLGETLGLLVAGVLAMVMLAVENRRRKVHDEQMS
jgi:Family of unknown function (DUF6064)